MARAQDTERATIIDSAYRALAASSGASVSVTEILQIAGLATRAFYRHFSSKDDLLLAVFRQESAAMLARLEAVVDETDVPGEALRRWIEEFLRIASSTRRRERAIVLSSDEITRAKGYFAARHEMLANQEASIAAVLTRGLADGTFPRTDPGPDARSVRAAVGQAFDDQIRGVAAFSATDAAAQVVDFAFRAVGLADLDRSTTGVPS